MDAKTFAAFAVLVAISGALATLLVYKSGVAAGSPEIEYLGMAEYWNGHRAALIIRIDDLVVSRDDWYLYPQCGIWSGYLIDALIEHDMKATLGLLTNRYGWIYPVNVEDWAYIEKLVSEHGFEIASHTRYHLMPPRSREDVVGSFRDIEGNLTGYVLLTYIIPYGLYDDLDDLYVREYGIPIMITIEAMYNSLKQPTASSNWRRMWVTTWWNENNSDLRHLFDRIYKRGGVMMVATHPHTFDWNNAEEQLESLKAFTEYLENKSVWYTTYGELWSYLYIASRVEVLRLNSTAFLVFMPQRLDGECARFWDFPITLTFAKPRCGDFEIYKNGVRLEEIGAIKNAGGYAEWLEGYRDAGDVVYVSIRLGPKGFALLNWKCTGRG